MSEPRVSDIIYKATGHRLAGDALRAFALANFDSLASGILADAGCPSIAEAVRETAATTPLPLVLLLGEYADQDPAGWLVSEKFDGVRATWDGLRFTSRNGNRFAVPAWFARQLPATALEGELHMGRGNFQQVPGALRRKMPRDCDWLRMTFHVFDTPDAPGGFADRLAAATAAIKGCAVARIAEHIACRDRAHLEAMMLDVVSGGGEGLVLRCPNAIYAPGVSREALKYKPIYSDEAVVVGHNFTREGCLRSLACRWRGVQWNLGQGLADRDRITPPAIGAAITFEYEAVTDSGKPRFARYIAVRDYE